MNNGSVQAIYDKCFNYLRTNAFLFFSFFICCQTYPCQVTAEPMVYYIFKDDNDIHTFLMSSCNLVVGQCKNEYFFAVDEQYSTQFFVRDTRISKQESLLLKRWQFFKKQSQQYEMR